MAEPSLEDLQKKFLDTRKAVKANQSFLEKSFQAYLIDFGQGSVLSIPLWHVPTVSFEESLIVLGISITASIINLIAIKFNKLGSLDKGMWREIGDIILQILLAFGLLYNYSQGWTGLPWWAAAVLIALAIENVYPLFDEAMHFLAGTSYRELRIGVKADIADMEKNMKNISEQIVKKGGAVPK